jgi:hypothetical protein
VSGACVFIGPSVTPDELLGFPTVTILPPAAAGDLYRATLAGFDPILLVDGYFHQVPSVQHKEILFALCQGVRVWGSSSMGALRAAEMADYGMVGIGQIFRWYRTGVYTSDDEVAVAHGDAESGYRALSEPMVNVRHALDLAADRGLVSPATGRRLCQIAKSMFYPERHWATIRIRGLDAGLPEDELTRLVRFVRAEMPDLKRDDALTALGQLLGPDRAAPTPTPMTFEATYNWAVLVGDRKERHDG